MSHKFDFSNNIMCPNCLTKSSTSWNVNMDVGELKCQNCKEIFIYEKELMVTYLKPSRKYRKSKEKSEKGSKK